MKKYTVFDDVVSMVEAGLASWRWTPIILEHPDVPDKLRIRVMEEPMSLPWTNGRKVRFATTAIELQRIADRIGSILHTERTYDQRHLQAKTIIQPVIRADGNIAAISTDARISELIDQALDKIRRGLGTPDLGSVSSLGKPWVLCKWLSPEYEPKIIRRWGDQTAYNFGWHAAGGRSVSPGGLRIWQPVISPDSIHVHNNIHRDPAQVCDLCDNSAELIKPDGTERHVFLEDIHQSETHWKLTSYSGPIPVRLPGVEKYTGPLVMAPIEVRGSVQSI